MRIILAIFSSFLTLIAYCQLDNGVYEGLESMGKGYGQWYHFLGSDSLKLRGDTLYI